MFVAGCGCIIVEGVQIVSDFTKYYQDVLKYDKISQEIEPFCLMTARNSDILLFRNMTQIPEICLIYEMLRCDYDSEL